MKLRLEDVADVVAAHRQLGLYQIRKKVRRRDIVYARHLCMYFMYKYCHASLKDIGKFLAPDRKKPLNHTTVIHGREEIVKALFIKNESIIADVSHIELSLSKYKADPKSSETTDDFIYELAKMLNILPLYSILPCKTFGELADQLNKKLENKYKQAS